MNVQAEAGSLDWAALEELDAREEIAVAGHRWDELLAIQTERRGLLDALPRTLPVAAKPMLERALARSQATERLLLGSLAETKGAIERLRGGRRAIGAYGAGGRLPRPTHAPDLRA